MSLEKLAYSYDELADATGISKDEIRKAVDNNYLTRRFLKTKPVFLATDVQAWLESLPTDRPQSAASPERLTG